MRVAQVTPYLSGIGGMEVYVMHLSRYLRDHGASVGIAVPAPGGESAQQFELERLQVLHYPVPMQPAPAEVQGLAPARGVEELHRWLRRERADIVHFHGLGLGMGVTEMEAARAVGAKTVLTLHLPSLGLNCLRGSMMRLGRHPCDGVAEAGKCAACVYEARGVPALVAAMAASLFMRQSGLARRLPGGLGSMAALPGVVRERMRIQQAAFAGCDAIVAVAEWAREVLLLNGAGVDRVVLNPVGISLRPAPVAVKPRGYSRRKVIRIGFVGRFDPDKGAQMLVRAFQRLPASGPAELELCGAVGAGTWSDELSRLRRLAQGDPRIRIRTNLSRDEIAATLPAYDVLCCPSRLFELGPMVVMEAQAAGVPAIGSDLPNINVLIDDGINGRLFPAGNEAALAELLAEIVRSPETTVRTWRQALGPVRTMDDVASDYWELYQRLLQPAATGEAAVPDASLGRARGAEA